MEVIAISIEQLFVDGKHVQVEARSWADTETVWPLLADPSCWPDWSPHIAAVRRARTGIVVAGERLRIHGLAGVRMGAMVTAVEAPRRWDFVAQLPGPWSLLSIHQVLPAPGTGTRVVISMGVLGPGAALLTRTVLLAYTLLARVAVQRLASLAATQAPSPLRS